MRIDIAAQTDVGRRKQKNEDYYGVFREDTPGLELFQEGALLCVADGLGGHVGGDIASKLSVSIMKDQLRKPPLPVSDGEDRFQGGAAGVLREGFRLANESVYRTNRDLVKSRRPMGTTLLSVLVSPDEALIANVGDSRCYHIREGEIIDRTRDHSWVDEQVDQGLMTKAEAESDFRKNIVTRSIGTHPVVEIDGYAWAIEPGDMLLLCTDGLVNMVKDPAIKDEFAKNASPAEIAQQLVRLANDNGGRDNITVIVADISPSLGTVMRRRVRSFSRRRGAKLVWLLLALLYGGLCFAAGYLAAGGI